MSYSVKKENLLFEADFSGFYSEIAKEVKNSIEAYWEIENDSVMLAVSDCKNIRDEYILREDDFFTSQIRIENHKPVLIRLNKEFINVFLDDTLDPATDEFNLRKMSSLEVKIFNNFCEYLYKQINTLLIDSKQVKITAASEKNINIVFFVATKNSKNAKIVLTIPQDRIDMVKLERKTSFSDEDFIHCSTNIKIRVGYSKLTLEELQNLSKDDTILLENSSLNHMTLVSGDIEQKFKVEVSDTKITSITDSDEETETNDGNEVMMAKNLWDDIQIELSAEFSKVKMTIGELKQISKGQVVDLGSIYDNEISLFIEDKKVAKGELLIINDKYAVKINEVLSSNVVQEKIEAKPQETKPAQPQAAAPQAQPAPKNPENAPQQAESTPQQQAPQPKKVSQHAVVEDEEFDYSDFEN